MKALNGAYYDPSKSGCGFVLATQKSSGTVAGSWFGHTNDGRNIWFNVVSRGPLLKAGSQLEFDVHGTKSGPFPVGSQVQTENVGELVLVEKSGKLTATMSVKTRWLATLHPSPMPPADHETVVTFDLNLLFGP